MKLLGAALLVGLALLFLTKPVKWGIKLVINSLGGLLLLWLVNQFGVSAGVHLPYTPLTIIVSGIFGFPGVLVLTLAQILV